MHIPDSMLNGAICPVTAAISAAGVSAAAVAALKAKDKPGALRFAAVTAFIFAAQMLNFPVREGTSGHLLGGVLASSLMGMPFGILAMTLVLAIQAVVFSDGGLSVLGANVLNMALIGAGFGGFLRLITGRSECSGVKIAAVAALSWLSVPAAALAGSIELHLAGTVSFSVTAVPMLAVHAWIGVGEALIAAACYYAFSGEAAFRSSPAASWKIPALGAGLAALILSPFASGFPDGLEWIAAKYQFLHESAPAFVSPLAGYAVPFIPNEILSVSAAGILGVLLTFLAAWSAARLLDGLRAAA